MTDVLPFALWRGKVSETDIPGASCRRATDFQGAPDLLSRYVNVQVEGHVFKEREMPSH